MKSIIVKIQVKAECVEQFKEITFYNSENARKEPGNLRFDVIADGGDPGLFFLYEIYKSDEAIAYHRTTEHYKKWAEAIADMIESERVRWLGEPICPNFEEAYKS
ncbi:MAG: antibiotic biosynthesis monooxygenase [Oscillospiraceae bacterium]|nr:antibiotic biosynthesis monooxygenase [Oscillospiraceae bacterium]